MEALIADVLPLADLLTPNRPEAEMLTGLAITDRDSLLAALEKILTFGPKAVLIKGGHMDEQGRPGDGLAGQARPRAPGPCRCPGWIRPTPTARAAPCPRPSQPGWPWGRTWKPPLRQAQAYLNQALTLGFAVGQGGLSAQPSGAVAHPPKLPDVMPGGVADLEAGHLL